jgi:hypothetical protein
VQTLVPGGDEAVPEPMDIEDMTSVGRNSQVWTGRSEPCSVQGVWDSGGTGGQQLPDTVVTTALHRLAVNPCNVLHVMCCM